MKGKQTLHVAVVLLCLGAAVFSLSFFFNQVLEKKLTGDGLEFLGAATMFIGGCLIVFHVSRQGLPIGLFLVGGMLHLFARSVDFAEEIPALLSYPLFPVEALSDRGFAHISGTCGSIVVFFAVLALLYEMAKLRDRAEADHRRYREAHESTLFLARVADMSGEAVVGVDRDGRIRSWNLGAQRLFNYSNKEAVTMPVTAILLGESDTKDGAVPDWFAGVDSVRQLELRGRTKTGREFPAATTLSPVLDDTQTPVGVSVSVQDVESRKARERDLIRARNLLANALQSLDVGVFILDRDMQPVEYNLGMEELTGFTREDIRKKGVTTKTVLDQLLGPDSAMSRAFVEEVYQKKKPIQYRNLRIRRKDNTERICNVALSPVLDEAGEMIAAAGVAVDITQREELQAQLLAAQKMESLGRMAGGIAHDFNNILSGVLGYASLMREKLDPSDSALRIVSAIEDSARRASELTYHLLAFAKGGESHFETVPLNQAIQETLDLFMHSLRPNIRLSFSPCAGPLSIEADPSQIKQVFMNVLINARDAIEGPGVIEVSTDVVPAGSGPRRHEMQGLLNGFARVCIADNGRGMTPEVCQRAFEPFFSLKEHSKGYGLGLSTAYGIVNAHRGQIRVDSKPGQGTQVEIRLPLTGKEPSTVGPQPATPRQLLTGRETILVVDDEQLVRSVISDILRTAGYDVLLAEDGDKAITLLERHGKDVALVVLDLLMPGKDGLEVLRALRNLKPQLPCIFSSGFGTDEVEIALGNDPWARILPKPYEARTLAAAVRELLNA